MSKKSIRTIDVDGETIALLREQQERQLFDRRACGAAYRADLDLVFCRPGGSPHDPNVIGRRFERRVLAVGRCPRLDFTPCATPMPPYCSRAGVDVKTVSERLGHHSVQTTLELYGHVTPRMRSNAAVRFGSLLAATRTPVATATVEN